MSAHAVGHKVWVEEQQRVQDAVDIDRLRALLEDIAEHHVERRGTAQRVQFQAFSDAAGRYPVDAMLMRAQRCVVAVLDDDLYRVGDAFYLGMNGKIVPFRVARARAGRRSSDAPTTRVLYLEPAH